MSKDKMILCIFKILQWTLCLTSLWIAFHSMAEGFILVTIGWGCIAITFSTAKHKSELQ